MATNNPYHITTPYEVESQLAGYQKNVQDAQLGQLQLDETKRKLSEEALARNVKAEAVKGLQTSQEQAAPTAPMGFDGQAQQQPATPVPAPEQGSAAFWKGQPTAAPQPEQPAPATPVQQYREAKKDVDLVAGQIKEYATIAKALKDKGLVDQAEAYTAKGIALQDKADAAKDKFLDQSIKVMNQAGNLANGYLEVVKKNPNDPVAQNAAWQRMMLETKATLGADELNKLSQIPPEQREQAAQQALDQTEDAKSRAAMAREQYKIQRQAAAKATTDELRLSIERERTKRQGIREAGINTRWEAGQGLQAYKTQEASAKGNVSIFQRDRDDYDQQIAALDNKIRDYNTVSNIGIPKDEWEQNKATLQEQRNLLQTQRDSVDNDVKEAEKVLTGLQSNFKASGLKDTSTATPKTKSNEFNDKVSYRFTQGSKPEDISHYKDLMSQAKTREEKLIIQKKAFEYGLVEPK